ncbi:phage putative tail component [Desulforamulus reducens MI-1]|uniref:Phage putative tail component n=1 Tax=Desulforamulus reducens (strain ATCC BAA-1160 / DSM 100696 / MI-1) TaxID=349161 RepID=A4J7Q4_DESRM|nr:distal tail protein Dit [Desulforamulus reducens]ABO51107.1 phage putative tail component [Desulforamulus reducens MI-1]
MRGFSFKGRHCSEYGVIMRSKNRPILSGVNDSYLQIPGRHGTYLFGGELADRTIDLECAILAGSLPDLRSKFREISSWLYSPKRENLVFDDELDKYYLAKLDGQIDVEQARATGKFDLKFRCEPLAYGGDIENLFINDQVTVFNQGTYEALPLFQSTFIQPATEWRVNKATEYIRVVRGFAPGDVLEVNCATGAILLNSVRILESLDWQNSIFFAFPPGEHTLNIAPAGVCNTKIIYKPRWL